ncbi:MAG TPA: hypothetical protein VEA16_19590 [Vicinamibacterales bacterium]|nr:hypothetical protein [Vicinamibacterales bacterium]
MLSALVLTVYVFTTTDCPISNRYAPEIQRLAAKFASQATFVLVYPTAGDSDEKIREHKKKFGYALESRRDPSLQLVRHTGVTVAPEVAVMSGTSVLYRGRIDDRYVDFGKDRPAPTRRDLEEALTAAIAGKPIAVKETRAVGCFLQELVK